MIGKVKKFIQEAISELKKVSWSSREELIGATMVVIVTTGILAVFIGIVDFALSKLLNVFIR